MNQDRVHKAKKRRLRPLFISLFIEYLEYAMAKLIKYFLLYFSWSRKWSNTLLFIFLTSKLSQNLSNLWIWANTPFSKVFKYLCRRFSGPCAGGRTRNCSWNRFIVWRLTINSNRTDEPAQPFYKRKLLLMQRRAGSYVSIKAPIPHTPALTKGWNEYTVKHSHY